MAFVCTSQEDDAEQWLNEHVDLHSANVMLHVSNGDMIGRTATLPMHVDHLPASVEHTRPAACLP